MANFLDSTGLGALRDWILGKLPTKTSDLTNDSGFVTTDTKNTAGATTTSSKMWLVGATAQTANPQTYTNSRLYYEGGIHSSAHNGGGTSNIDQAVGYVQLMVNDQYDDTTMKIYTDGKKATIVDDNANDVLDIRYDGTSYLHGLATPTADTDAANKKYVDDNIPTATSDLTNDSGFIAEDGNGDISVTRNINLGGNLASSAVDFYINAENVHLLTGTNRESWFLFTGAENLRINKADGTAKNYFVKHYVAGDSFSVDIDTAGFITNSAKEVRFTIPLTRPVMSGVSARLTYGSGQGFVLRNWNNYTHGSSASAAVKPSTTYVYVRPFGLVVNVLFSSTANATNNSSVGINCTGTITFY